MLRMAPILLAGALALALTSSAQATIVYVHEGRDGAPDELRAIDDNGADSRTLLSADDIPAGATTSGGTYGVTDLTGPSTHPAGDAVVFSGEWDRSYGEWSRWVPTQGISTACGAFCVGVYVLAEGKVQRLSPDPYACPLNPCAMLETDAEIAADGSVVLEQSFANWASKCDGGTRWCDTSFDHSIHRRTGPGEAVRVKTGCEDKGANPAPSPVEAGWVLHTGCSANTDQGFRYNVSLTNGTDSFGHLWSDDWEAADPSWSPDGGQVTVYESDIGQEPGIWVNTLPAGGGNIQFRRAVVTGSADHISTPRLTNAGKLIFIRNDNLFSVPATCNECALSLGEPAHQPRARQRQRIRLDLRGDDRAASRTDGLADADGDTLAEPDAGCDARNEPDADRAGNRPGRDRRVAAGPVDARAQALRRGEEGAGAQRAEVPHHARKGRGGDRDGRGTQAPPAQARVAALQRPRGHEHVHDPQGREAGAQAGRLPRGGDGRRRREDVQRGDAQLHGDEVALGARRRRARSWPAMSADDETPLGQFIRGQRELHDMSMRQLAAISGISAPYMSQIEHGLRDPSERVLRSIADGLRLSADTLLERAGAAQREHDGSAVEEAIRADPGLTAVQRRSLIEIYRALVAETERRRE